MRTPLTAACICTNTASEKWQFLNSYKDGTITADTAGSYLLTNQNLRFTNINWTFFIAAGALTVVCLIVYIAVKETVLVLVIITMRNKTSRSSEWEVFVFIGSS